MLILWRLFLLKSIAIEPGLLELLQKVAGVRFFLRHSVCVMQLQIAVSWRMQRKQFLPRSRWIWLLVLDGTTPVIDHPLAPASRSRSLDVLCQVVNADSSAEMSPSAANGTTTRTTDDRLLGVQHMTSVTTDRAGMVIGYVFITSIAFSAVHGVLCKFFWGIVHYRACWNVLILWLWSTVSSACEWVLYTDPSHVLVLTSEWSEIMGSCSTPNTAVRLRTQN